ncbi:Bax inhibitor-1 family protein [Patescibacteria group bacterium]|nr:Bax inhibitor-1 family protein [Patescibacteria group bacterium]
MDITRSVWNRKTSPHVPYLTKQAYAAAVSGFTVYGMALASVIAYLCLDWQVTSILAWLFVGLVIPIIGIIIAFSTKNWFFSFIGYTMVVTGMGAICGPTVAQFETGVVINALLATCGVTIVMSLAGVMIKRSLESWGMYLFGALVVVLLVSIARLFFPVSWVAPAADAKSSVVIAYYLWYVFDYLVAILFCFYIIYDWNRALRLPRTLDNAVDSSVALFLDVINLFIRILAIMGRKK